MQHASSNDGYFTTDVQVQVSENWLHFSWLNIYLFLGFYLTAFFSGAQNLDDESLILSDAQGGEDCGKTSRAEHARKKLDRKD